MFTVLLHTKQTRYIRAYISFLIQRKYGVRFHMFKFVMIFILKFCLMLFTLRNTLCVTKHFNARNTYLQHVLRYIFFII